MEAETSQTTDVERFDIEALLPPDLLRYLLSCLHPREARRAGLCGWEWLLELAVEELKGYTVRPHIFRGAADWVRSCDFSPDGTCFE